LDVGPAGPKKRGSGFPAAVHYKLTVVEDELPGLFFSWPTGLEIAPGGQGR